LAPATSRPRPTYRIKINKNNNLFEIWKSGSRWGGSKKRRIEKFRRRPEADQYFAKGDVLFKNGWRFAPRFAKGAACPGAAAGDRRLTTGFRRFDFRLDAFSSPRNVIRFA
jgi:hypothetical protein